MWYYDTHAAYGPPAGIPDEMDGMGWADTIRQNFERLGLPAAARDWLIDVWTVCQVLDDAADGDEIGRERAEDAAWAVFVRMPANSFWRDNYANLLPVLAVQVLKWRAANEAEASGIADERSYMWRAGYYDLVLMVCQLCGLSDDPQAILATYGETYAEYAAEWRRDSDLSDGDVDHA